MLSFPIHSPLQRLHDPRFEAKGVQLWIKRDDLIHPYLSGNKWRKLKFVLNAAQKANKNHLVTFGGAWSNHLLATAFAGQNFGFRTSAFVRGETLDNAVLQLCQNMGMTLHLASRAAYRDKTTLFQTTFGQDPEAFLVGEGGHSLEATLGCASLMDEIPSTADHLFCAMGTGTTLAGLSRGIQERKRKTHLHGIPVLKGASYLIQEVQTLYPTSQFHCHLDYHMGGYAKTPPELIDFIQAFYVQHEILLDPIYTSKMAYAAYDLLDQNVFVAGEQVILLHTGGLSGWLGKREALGDLPLPAPFKI